MLGQVRLPKGLTAGVMQQSRACLINKQTTFHTCPTLGTAAQTCTISCSAKGPQFDVGACPHLFVSICRSAVQKSLEGVAALPLSQTMSSAAAAAAPTSSNSMLLIIVVCIGFWMLSATISAVIGALLQLKGRATNSTDEVKRLFLDSQ